MFDGNDPSNGIVWSLKRLFDTPTEVEKEVREKRATLRGQRKAEGDPPTFRCRVCGLEGPESAFCSECLAGTMEAVKPPR